MTVEHHDEREQEQEVGSALVLAPEVLDGEIVDEIHRVSGSELSPDACAVVAGLVSPPSEVHHPGINAGAEVWNEIRAVFPAELFWAWVAQHPADPNDDDCAYNPHADE